jgi:hypothetical protein
LLIADIEVVQFLLNPSTISTFEFPLLVAEACERCHLRAKSKPEGSSIIFRAIIIIYKSWRRLATG